MDLPDLASIFDTLTASFTALKAENDQLRAELDSANGIIVTREAERNALDQQVQDLQVQVQAQRDDTRANDLQLQLTQKSQQLDTVSEENTTLHSEVARLQGILDNIDRAQGQIP